MLLINMGFQGNQFTWRRGRSGNTFIAKRLDQVLDCAQTRLKWQDARVSHLPFLASDHTPLYIQLARRGSVNAKRRPFKFEAAWLQHSGYKELLANSWNSSINTQESLGNLQVFLRKWNKQVFGDIQGRKDKLVKDITEVQNSIDQCPLNALFVQEDAFGKGVGNGVGTGGDGVVLKV